MVNGMNSAPADDLLGGPVNSSNSLFAEFSALGAPEGELHGSVKSEKTLLTERSIDMTWTSVFAPVDTTMLQHSEMQPVNPIAKMAELQDTFHALDAELQNLKGAHAVLASQINDISLRMEAIWVEMGKLTIGGLAHA